METIKDKTLEDKLLDIFCKYDLEGYAIGDIEELLTTEIDARLESLKMEKEFPDRELADSEIDWLQGYNTAVSEINERIEKMKGEK